MSKIISLILIMILSFSIDSFNQLLTFENDSKFYDTILVEAEKSTVVLENEFSCQIQEMEGILADSDPTYWLTNAYIMEGGGVWCYSYCINLLCCEVRIILNPDLE